MPLFLGVTSLILISAATIEELPDIMKTIQKNEILEVYNYDNINGGPVMDNTDSNKQRSHSGKAEVLFDSEWKEVFRKQGKNKDQPYEVPKSAAISVRFDKNDVGKRVRVFLETDIDDRDES